MDGVVHTKQPEPAVGNDVDVCKGSSRTKTSRQKVKNPNFGSVPLKYWCNLQSLVFVLYFCG